jgi:hypothetical protein
VVNHIKFLLPNPPEQIAKWKAAGMIAEHLTSEYGGNPIGWAYTPDDLKIRFNPDKSLKVSIGSPGIQIWGRKPDVIDMLSWYVTTFGGKLADAPSNNGWSIDGIPGARITITYSGEVPAARTPRGVGMIQGKMADQGFVDKLARTNFTLPTKGRTLDHIGFEVKNLEAFCKKLEARKIKFTEPYSKTRNKSFASAAFVDPWGVSIELTEGLNRF